MRALRCLLELGFHDNEEDAQWIVSHIQAMAASLVLSLTEYFGIPFSPPAPPMPGEVRLDLGVLDVYPPAGRGRHPHRPTLRRGPGNGDQRVRRLVPDPIRRPGGVCGGGIHRGRVSFKYLFLCS